MTPSQKPLSARGFSMRCISPGLMLYLLPFDLLRCEVMALHCVAPALAVVFPREQGGLLPRAHVGWGQGSRLRSEADGALLDVPGSYVSRRTTETAARWFFFSMYSCGCRLP